MYDQSLLLIDLRIVGKKHTKFNNCESYFIFEVRMMSFRVCKYLW